MNSCPAAQHARLPAAGTGEAVRTALTTLQQHFFPEVVRNTQLFTELFERSARPALIRVRPSPPLQHYAAFLLTCQQHWVTHVSYLPSVQVSREVLGSMQTIFRDLLAVAVQSSSQAAGRTFAAAVRLGCHSGVLLHE